MPLKLVNRSGEETTLSDLLIKAKYLKNSGRFWVVEKDGTRYLYLVHRLMSDVDTDEYPDGKLIAVGQYFRGDRVIDGLYYDNYYRKVWKPNDKKLLDKIATLISLG